MSKLDDKLRNLKNDIPKFSSELDNRVLNAVANTPKKPKFTFPNWGVIAASLTPVLAMVIILVVVNNNANSPLASNGETAEFVTTSTPANNEDAQAGQTQIAAPGETTPLVNFLAIKSETIPVLLFGNESEFYSEEKLTYATSKAQLTSEINKYQPDYGALLEPLANEIVTTEEFFSDNILVIVPFLSSSSEENIKLVEVRENKNGETMNFVFELFSPSINTTDIQVQFYLVSLKRAVFTINPNYKLSISVINTCDGDTGSVHYNK